MRINPILNTDSYKLSHFLQYPPNTTNVSSYIEARKGGNFPYVLFFGLQAFIKEYLLTPINEGDIMEAEIVAKAHGVPFNRAGWYDIVHLHDGYLPIRIEALPEGHVYPVGIPLVQVTATDPAFFWLVSYIETALLRAVWYPSTVATYSFTVKQMLKEFLDISADDDSGLPFMLHDFGARGVSSYESSLLGGAAHLINFQGTDTLACLTFIQDTYNMEAIPAFSVPAAEHSTITSWGESHEIDAYDNMLTQFGTGGIVSIVADSYDLFNAVDNIFGATLKPQIEAMNARLVVRPDSGDPLTIVLATVEKLGNAFGYTTNSKGFKVLNPKVRVLQGDGVNLESIEQILDVLLDAGWSAENVVFGMGGALLQGQMRDDLRFAMKCNAVEVNGVWQDVYKKPATDLTKSSKAGRQAVIYHHLSGEVLSMRLDTYVDTLAAGGSEHFEEGDNLLRLVYKNGVAALAETFEKIRERANGAHYPHEE